jgi:SAM-dependent methyltransferase
MDTVVCLNVLEHVEDDLQGLRNIHGALTPGGRAIILVPQDQKLYGPLDAALGHFRRYSKEELRGRMEQAGFRVDAILDFNRISRPGWYLNGKVFRRAKLGRYQLRLFDRLVWLWRRIDASLPWPATSIIGIGVKK